MSLIQISNLTFAYDGSYDTIFENISLQIDTNWKLGFVGRNGRGKTTFLNLLLGKLAYQGSISHTASFDYFPFPVADTSLDTMVVIEQICYDYELWKLQRELSLLEVSEDALYRPFKTLSGGEQVKVLLAALFLKQNNFLLIDEPTNHLDTKAREIVSRYLRSKSSFILVSHDREFLDQCVDHILAINKTNIELQSGNFSSWWQNKLAQDDFELAEHAKLQKEIKKLSAAAKRTSLWSDKVEKSKNQRTSAGLRPDRGFVSHKAAKMMKRSKSLEKRQESTLSEKSKLLKNIESAEDLKIHPLSYHSHQLANFRNLSLFYGEKQVCDNINFTIDNGDRIAICGANGSGKSTLLHFIAQNSIACKGEKHLGKDLKISFVSQDTSFLQGSLREFTDDYLLDESLFKAILRKLDFSREQFDKNISHFSSGQKKKLLIAKSLCEQAHLYVWDEPLNYIDIFSRIQIQNLILEYKPTILFVEHDSAFIKETATKTVNL
ncbi:ribosomal protection-like ABC-F family protein [Scatolibacter rhodanostii]|uniref:ribosomal protection-like ABC-F family protein n=1 Tax=Scatolibacter rhodanostii TaxID=2014781 RepID=UPI000C07CF31|nr:ABC-F type ribosomal protection protein [Scatolibacter rhodanostii]